MEEILDINGGIAGAILMDLSKAFDTINHELLIAKLEAYGFDKSALTIILSYLRDRWQRTKINTSLSTWLELLRGMPQGSVLGPPWPTKNTRPHIMHFRRLVFSYMEVIY